MSVSQSKAKVEKRSKVAIWLNDLFRTKLEKDTDKLLDMMNASNENEVRGNSTFFYSRGGLQAEVVKKLRQPPVHIVLNELSVTYWCDVPKRLWKEFEKDGAFIQQLYDRVNNLTDRLIGEWAKRVTTWERVAAEGGDKVQEAIDGFDKDSETLRKECEAVAIEEIAGYFTTKAASYGNYKRYKFKAGAKLVSTCLGVVASIAALSTAATPAAPATIVPAIIGLVSAAMSIGKQVADLSASAEEIGAEIQHNLGKLQVVIKDKNGKPRKKTMKAAEFGSGFLAGLTGGASEVAIPSVKSLQDETGLHKSKLDGLSAKLHEMGNGINAMVDGLDLADKVLDDNKKKLRELIERGKTSREIQKAMKAVEDALHFFEGAKEKFVTAFETDVPAMIARLDTGLEKNAQFKEALDQIAEFLGHPESWGKAGNVLASLSMIAIGFSSGLPTEHVEKITSWTAFSWSGVDLIREYTPEVMEKLTGEE